MNTILRKLRGMFGMGLTWGVGSFGFVSGSLFGLIFSRAERRKSINDATLFNTVPLGASPELHA